MPFAGYKNFAACVAANQDKANPEAYCATIMRKVEKHYGPGDHPSGSSQQVHSPAQRFAQDHLSIDNLKLPTGGDLPNVYPDENISGDDAEQALLDKLHFIATDMHMIDSHGEEYARDHRYLIEGKDYKGELPPFWYQSRGLSERKLQLKTLYEKYRRELLVYRLRDWQKNPRPEDLVSKVLVQKHGGPGPHANGSPQSAHGVRGSATVPRLASASKRGFTVDNRTGETPKTGFAVALPGYEATTTVKDRNQLMEFISKFRAEKWSVWEDTPNAYFGGWLDNISKELFLDVTIVLDNKEDAIALGRHYNQKAIYDLGTFTEIRLDQAEAPVA